MKIQYLAGFFDGEGSISFKYMNTSHPLLKLQIGQKEEEVLNLILKEFGGNIESGGKSVKSVKRWVLYGKKAKDLSIRMLPYLIVKKSNVSKCLTFISK